jgi:hypothetical protein
MYLYFIAILQDCQGVNLAVLAILLGALNLGYRFGFRGDVNQSGAVLIYKVPDRKLS